MVPGAIPRTEKTGGLLSADYNKEGQANKPAFYFAHNCAHLRTISHHFLYIKLYDVIRKSIVFIKSVSRFVRGAFFNTKLKRVIIVEFNIRRNCRWLCRAEIRKT